MTLIFSAAFTGADTTQLQSYTPDIGASFTRLWGDAGVDWVITSNQINPETAADKGSMYTCDATYDSADYYAEFTLVTGPGASTTRASYLCVRIQDVDNLYAVRLIGGAGASSLYTKVLGVWVAVGSGFTCPANGSVCKLDITGNTLTFYDGGASVASATVLDIVAAGKAGLAAGGGAELVTSTDDSNTSIVWDTLSVVTTVAAGGSVNLLHGKLGQKLVGKL